jgi:ligand-binding sensor domain-containing protein/serine phosphatase RsbU (regulator of sigma subunit)
MYDPFIHLTNYLRARLGRACLLPMAQLTWFFGAVLAWALANPVVGQERSASFKRFSVENGLAQNTVQCVYQDGQGFIWVGTQAGLNRYDGYAFTTFRHNAKDSASLSDNMVWAIHEDRQGRLWVGTGRGLNLYDRRRQRFELYRSKTDGKGPDERVFTIFEDRGQLWLGTDRGVFRFNPDTKKFIHYGFVKRDGPKFGSVYSITTDKMGNIVAGSLGRGVLVFRPASDQFEPYPLYPKNLQADYVTRLWRDSNGNLWVGALNGLRKLSPDNQPARVFQNQENQPNSLSFNYITALTEDQRGNIWAGTREGGLNCLLAASEDDQPGFVHYNADTRNPNSLSSNQISCLFTDRSGIVWVGTDGGGLSLYDDGKDKFRRLNHQPGDAASLSHDLVKGLGVGRDSTLWVATGGGGLNRLDLRTKKFSVYRHQPGRSGSLADDYVTCVLQGRNGDVWAGTVRGLSRLRAGQLAPDQFVNLKSDLAGLSDNHVTCLLEDQRGVVWIGTHDGGLNYYVPSTNQFGLYKSNLNTAGALSSNTVQALFQDRDGDLWVGTSDGLNRLDRKTETFTVYKNIPGDSTSLAHNSIKGFYQVPDGAIWIGTSGGLERLDKATQRFAHFGQEQGLPSNNVYSILADGAGNLWLGTGAGLTHFRLNSLSFHHYDDYDNLQGGEFSPGAAVRLGSGEMYFGGARGLNLFHPARIRHNSFVPPVSLTHVEVRGGEAPAQFRPLEGETELVLPYDQNDLAFQFVGLSFRHPEKNKYRYHLENFDRQWSAPGPARTARYTNLPPGSYLFKVQASNSDGVWNRTPATLRVVIRPPFWETWWFRLAAAGLLALAVYVTYRLRVRRVKEMNQRLAQQVAERTQEIVAQRDTVERSYNSIKVISQIGREITSELHQEELIGTAFASISRLMEVSMFRVGIYNPETKLLTFSGFAGKQAIKPYSHDTTSGVKRLSVICFQFQLELFINDFDREAPEYIGDEYKEYQINRPGSAIYLPLSVENQPVGVLTVQTHQKHAYTEEHLNILRTLGIYTAIAIDNAVTYGKLNEANLTIERRNEHILSGIRYAEKIQRATLPDDELMAKVAPEHFVFYQAKDIVSGDFYWCHQVGSKTFLAVVDCTGHGVPGAFMSIIGNNLLNEIIVRKGISDPAQILEELHNGVRVALQQDDKANDDGMDVCLCVIKQLGQVKLLTYAGAKRPLFMARRDKVEIIEREYDAALDAKPPLSPPQRPPQFSIHEFKGSKKSVGGRQKEPRRVYEQQEIKLESGDVLYLTTDGFIDQNNALKEKYGTPQLKELLREVSCLPLPEQLAQLQAALKAYRGKEPQRDDITMIGVKV